MPNWCQNHITVTDATPEFRAWLKDGFSFHRMNPVILPQTTHESVSDSWNDLEAYYSAWGTKWDMDENDQRQIANDLLESGEACFDTAWSPPLRAIEALSKMFACVCFRLHYCELGMFFAGTAVFVNGMCRDDHYEREAEVMKIACEVFGYEDEETCEEEVST